MRVVLLFLIGTIAMACSPNPLVGEWKAVRTFDPIRKQLVPVAYEGLLEVSHDGTFKVILPDGSQRTGKYKLDEAVTPHRFTATEKDGRTVRGIYWVASDALGVRIADGSVDSEVPTDFIDLDDDNNRGVIEFERKK